MQLNKLLLFVLFTMSMSSIKGAHIVGGDMTYSCLSIDSINQITTFRFTCTMYRDSRGGGAPFDDPATFGVYEKIGQVFIFQQPRIRIRVEDIEDLTEVDDPCVTIPPNVGVQRGIYTFDVTLRWNEDGYKIAYQRCCRNNSITNIVAPEATGAVFEVDITREALRSCNNSPVFNSFPPIVLCAGNPVSLDLSASDIDGDQVLYEFCLPKSSGGRGGNGCQSVIPDPADCLPPFRTAVYDLPTFSVNQPLGVSANMSLDPSTGQLTLTPQVQGQFVVGVCVKEFRDGRLISEISRDFQFNIALCEALVTAEVTTDDNGTNVEGNGDILTIEACNRNTILFDNSSTSAFGDPTFLWQFAIPGNVLKSEERNAELTFPGPGTYPGIMVVNPDNGCTDTSKINVIIHPPLTADFSIAYDTCLAGPVSFIDQSTVQQAAIVDWTWLVEADKSFTTQNPIHRYRSPGVKEVSLAIEDSNECRDSIIKNIEWSPAPDVVVIRPSDEVGCVPATINFNNLSSPVDTSYDVTWDMGDSTILKSIDVTHIYERAGEYDIYVKIISPEGCETEQLFRRAVLIEPAPVAGFEFEPEDYSNRNSSVDFVNTSENAQGYYWTFGNEGASFEVSPSYTFQDTGLMNVTLVAYHREGCSDTLIQQVDIEPISTLFSPNAFTPNNDGLNDSFKPEGDFFGISEYNLSIWNRWGQQVFSSENPLDGWNGEDGNSGQLAPQGVYVYKIHYLKPRGEQIDLSGHVTLIR